MQAVFYVCTMAKTEYQSGTVELLWRSDIREHPMNPRTISEAAKKKLRASVKEIGVMDTPVFNRLTGRLVGGHQRLHTIDFLEKFRVTDDGPKNDYQIEVSVVEMDEAQEAKALVRLNNQNLQGGWDAELLRELNLAQGISFEEMGFDRVDMEIMFDDAAAPTLVEFDGDAQARETRDALQDIKADRKAMNERQQKDNNGDWYVTIVCKDAEEKHRLMRLLKLPKGESFISPVEIFAALDSA